MRVLLVADMRSTHSLGWVKGLMEMGIEPVIVSSRSLSDPQRSQLPPRVAAAILHEPQDNLSRSRRWLTAQTTTLHAARSVARGVRSKTMSGTYESKPPQPEGTGRLELPLELAIAKRLGRSINKIADECRPDLVHALRIPFEGIAATDVSRLWPFAISTWGSDLARQAPAHPRLAFATRQALTHVDALHADCERDIMLAREWGVSHTAISLMAAGNMGFDDSVFYAKSRTRGERSLVVLPRGVATNVNYIGLLEAASQLVPIFPKVTFVGVRLKGDAAAEEIRAKCSIPMRIVLTANLTSHELAELYQNAIAVVSPSISDGTPNSVVEGMACGALPIVGDIEPLRDLLGDHLAAGLVDPTDDKAIQSAMQRVIELTEAHWEELSQVSQSVARGQWGHRATFPRVHAWYKELIPN